MTAATTKRTFIVERNGSRGADTAPLQIDASRAEENPANGRTNFYDGEELVASIGEVRAWYIKP